MGEYVSIRRRVWQGLSRSCHWCGGRGRLFSYNGQGPFCNRSCAESYGAISDEARLVPIEVVRP